MAELLRRMIVGLRSALPQWQMTPEHRRALRQTKLQERRVEKLVAAFRRADRAMRSR